VAGKRHSLQDRPTSFDIAQRAGVSQPTVSRALRGSPMVSEATRRKIIEIARELGYTVDKSASALRSQKTHTLALLLFEDPSPDESAINPFFLAMLGSITRHCALRGYDLLISFQAIDGDWHLDYEDSGKADGMILLGYGDYQEYRWRLEQLVEKGARFVRWGSMQEGQPGLTLGCDNWRGGYEVTRHLIGLGRKRIAFIGAADSSFPEFQDRWRGYRQAIEEAGLSAAEELRIDAVSSDDAGRAATEALIARARPFDAIVAASDLIAIGAMEALQAAKIATPDEVAVTGFDDILAAGVTRPPLTTVAQEANAAGAKLVETLIALIDGESVAAAPLPVRLVVRESCGAKLPARTERP
jgi:DNA-binding LacI/PurR family transcriptional regulator